MKITKRELKNYEILQLFNEFVKNLNTEGLNPKYSLMLYKNIEALTIPYNNIIGSVYNEANDTEYQKSAPADRRNKVLYLQASSLPS